MSEENEGIRHIEIHRKKRSNADSDSDNSDATLEKSPSPPRRPPPRTQLLRGDSDQVSLDSLLKAVLDIDDRLHEQEEKLKSHENVVDLASHQRHKDTTRRKRRDRMCPKTAVHKYANDDGGSGESSESEMDLNQSFTSSRGTSKHSGSRKTTRSARMFAKPPSVVVGTESRKNISFSNDTVRKIDAENQRLLKGIIQAKAKNVSQRKTPVIRPQSASSINRLRQQKEIERENMRMLGRLQAVKPTESLSRNTLITDHTKNEERLVRISRTGRSRPSSAASTRSCSSRAEGTMDMFDTESVLSVASSMRSMRSSSSKISSASTKTSASSRPSSAKKKKKIQVHKVWEPGW